MSEKTYIQKVLHNEGNNTQSGDIFDFKNAIISAHHNHYSSQYFHFPKKENFYIKVLMSHDENGFANKTEIIDNIHKAILNRNQYNILVEIDNIESECSKDSWFEYFELFFGSKFQDEIRSDILKFIHSFESNKIKVNLSKIQKHINELSSYYDPANDRVNRELSNAVSSFIYNNIYLRDEDSHLALKSLYGYLDSLNIDYSLKINDEYIDVQESIEDFLSVQLKHNNHNNSWINLYHKFKYGDIFEMKEKIELIDDELVNVRVCLASPVLIELDLINRDLSILNDLMDEFDFLEEMLCSITDNHPLEKGSKRSFDDFFNTIEKLIIASKQENLSQLHDKYDALVNNRWLRIFNYKKWQKLMFELNYKKTLTLMKNWRDEVKQ